MASSNIDIKILTEFLGKSAFKQAETATNKLNKTVKTLGQSFGIAFGGAALGYAIKTAIKDFADAERETVALTNTVKNLGLAFDAPVVNAYVDSIGKLYGVTGAQAVPAMQALLSATGSVSKSTDIMNVALDLAASRSADVGAVASDLANAYVGNTKALSQYRLGLTKAELSAMTFDQILDKIATDTLGAADEAAQSLSGKMAILAESANQAKERIGGGLVDALGGLAGPNGAGGAAQTIENLSTKLTNAITGVGYLVREIKIAQPILVTAGIAIGLAWAPWFTAISVAALAVGALGNALKKNSTITPMNTGPLLFPTMGDGGYKKREAARKKAEQEAIARNKQLAKLVKDQAKSAADILKKKQLQNAVDKANLLLGKGEGIFDLEAIQYNAALINQADQLGKTTNAAQMLAIANDVARLNVKKAMYELEQAIASGDIVAIQNATARLNEDLKIYNALSGQKTQMMAIESILKGLTPKELIDQKNLDEALRKIRELLAELGKVKIPTAAAGGGSSYVPIGKAQIEKLTPAEAEKILSTMPSSVPTDLTPAEISGNRYEAQAKAAFDKIVSNIDLEGIAQDSFTQGIDNGLGIAASLSGARYAAQAKAAAGGVGSVNITVNTGVGDPNAIAEAIDQVLNDAVQRGTLRGYVPA
jgi:hypothetical protein